MPDTIQLPSTLYQKILQFLSFLLLLGQFICLLLFWQDLPDKIPTHWNLAGQADSWGQKGALLFLPVLSVILYLMLLLVEHFPSIWNVPGKVTQKNILWIYGNVKTMLITMKFTIMACFLYLTLCALLGKNLGLWFLPLFFAAMFLPMIYYLRRCKKYN